MMRLLLSAITFWLLPFTAVPFSNVIRPFTVNGRQTLCFVNINELLGFEVGDLRSGKMLHRVEVQGYEKLVDIVFAGDRPVRAGDQFGIGRRQER